MLSAIKDKLSVICVYVNEMLNKIKLNFIVWSHVYNKRGRDQGFRALGTADTHDTDTHVWV